MTYIHLFLCLLVTVTKVATQEEWSFVQPKQLYMRQKDMFPTNQLMRDLLQLRSKINKPELPKQSRFHTVLPPPVPTELNDIDDDVSNVKFVEPPVVHMNHHSKLSSPLTLHMQPLVLCGYKELAQDQICYNNQPYNAIYFGICGTRLFKKPSHFCYDGKTYDRLHKSVCGNKIYDRIGEVCVNNQVESLCGGEVFDPQTHFCYEKVYDRIQYSLCRKKVYRKNTHFCYKGKVIKKAKMEPILTDQAMLPRMDRVNILNKVQGYPVVSNDIPLTSLKSYVSPINVHEKIANKQFKKLLGNMLFRNFAKSMPSSILVRQKTGDKKDVLPKIHRSKNAVRHSLPKTRFGTCGHVKYNDKTHFCYNDILHQRCGMISYNPNLLVCFHNFLYKKAIYDLCGKDLYNKFTQACQNNRVFQRHQMTIANRNNNDHLNEEPEDVKTLETLLLQYRKTLENSENQHLLDYSKTLLKQRHQIEKTKRCILKNPKLQFCYGDKPYYYSLFGICGQKLFQKRNYQCLNGHVLFPIIART